MRQRSSDDDLNAQEMVLVSSIMGDAAHRLPWAMPSQQERMLLKALARPSETRGLSDANAPRVPQTVHSTRKLYPTLNIPDGHSSQASTGALPPPRKRSATFHVEPSAPSLHPDVSAETSPASRRSGRVNAPRHFLINVAEEDIGPALPASRRSRPTQQAAADRSSLDDSSEQRTDGLESSDLGNRYAGDESSTSEGSYLEERDSSEGEIEYPTPLNPGRGGRRFGSSVEDTDDIRPGGVQLRQRRGYHHTSARSRNLTRPTYDLMRDNVLAMSSDDREALRRLLNDGTS